MNSSSTPTIHSERDSFFAELRHRLQEAIDVLHVVVDRGRESHPVLAESNVHLGRREPLRNITCPHVFLRERDVAALRLRWRDEGEAESRNLLPQLLEHRLAVRLSVLEAERFDVVERRGKEGRGHRTATERAWLEHARRVL